MSKSPKTRRRMSAAAKAMWRRPGFRKRQSAAMKAGWRRGKHVRRVTVNGRTMSFPEAVERANLKRATVVTRLRYGWSIEEALGLVKRPRTRGRPKRENSS
jgi:hypothetical protein